MLQLTHLAGFRAECYQIPLDEGFAIGPVPMMRACSELTRPYAIKTMHNFITQLFSRSLNEHQADICIVVKDDFVSHLKERLYETSTETIWTARARQINVVQLNSHLHSTSYKVFSTRQDHFR